MATHEDYDKHYYVRRLRHGQNLQSFEVAVFDGHDEPSEVYIVVLQPRRVHCNCGGFKWKPNENHKHIRLVKLFLEKGEPDMATFALDGEDPILLSQEEAS